MRHHLAALLLSAPLLAPAFAWAGPSTNLVVNGSFEQLNGAGASQGGGSWSIYNGSIHGWHAVPNVEVRNQTAGNTPFGNSYVELDTNAGNRSNSRIWQMLDTIAGQTYELSFSYAQRPDQQGSASNGLCWQIDNLDCVAFGQDTKTDWTTLSVQFVAKGNHTRLGFAAIGTADTYGTSLDNISVMAQEASHVPEPASLALASLGMAAAGFASRRRRRAD